MERLPPPVDQAGPRSRSGQHGGSGGNAAGLPTQTASHDNRSAAGDGTTQAARTSSISTMFRIVRRGRQGSSGDGGSSNVGSDLTGGPGRGNIAPASGTVYRVAAAEGVRVRRGADPQSAQVAVLGEGSELVVVEELSDGNGGVWMRLSAPVEGWIGRRSSSVVALPSASRRPPGTASGWSGTGRSSAGLAGLDADGNETGEAAEVALAKELEDCMEEEAGTDVYRRDERLFGSRQGWSLPSGGACSLGTGGWRSGNSGADARVSGERREAVVGHASVSGCWVAVASMSVSVAKDKLAGTAATLAVLHCRKILLTVLLQCHNEVMRTTTGGQTAADALLSQRVAALVGARDSTPLPSASRASGTTVSRGGNEASAVRASPATLRTRVAARQLSSFLQLVLFRGWRPGWLPLASGGGPSEGQIDATGRIVYDHESGEIIAGQDEEGNMCLDDKEPMSDRFRSLPVVLTPLVSCLIRAAAVQRSSASGTASSTASGGAIPAVAAGRGLTGSLRVQSFGAQVEEAMLQSVASQLRQATRIGQRDQAWASSDVSMSDAHCLRYPRLQYVTWAARVVQAGSGAPAVPRRVFHAWAAGLRSPSLPVKQQVCSELSRLLDEAVQAVDRARRACAADATGADADADAVQAAVLQRDMAARRLGQCVKLLPLERLRSLAERRMLKEGEDEPMLSRALQSIVDLVASAELAGRVLRECEAENNAKEREETAAAAAVAAGAVMVVSKTMAKTGEAYATGNTDDNVGKDSNGRAVLCFPSPSAYVTLQGRDLEPPWTAEFWVLRPNADGTWGDDDTPSGDTDKGQEDDFETERSSPCASHGKGERSPSLHRRELMRSISERLTPTPAVVLPCISRAISTPSVDLSQLPPTDSKERAPALVRAPSADTVGQDDGEAGDHAGNAPPADKAEAAAAAAAGATLPRATGDGNVLPSSDARWADRMPSFDGAFADSQSRSGRQQTTPAKPWWDGRDRATGVGSRSGGGAGAIDGPAAPSSCAARESRPGRDVNSKAAPGGQREAMSRKGEMGIAPAEYLASSQAGHVKIQAGGTVFSSSVGQFPSGSGDSGDEMAGWKEESKRPVLSEALCVSVGAAGEKERAFDFAVPTGRWVHLAIVASAPSEARTTLYVDGTAVDTISLRMSLPMGCFGVSPHAQEASASGSAGGGSFVGLLAQAR